MLLVFDVGNTNIVLGVYDGAQLLYHWRISTDRQKTADEYGVLLNSLFIHRGLGMDDIKAAIISSVVPPLMAQLTRMCQRYFERGAPGCRAGDKDRHMYKIRKSAGSGGGPYRQRDRRL